MDLAVVTSSPTEIPSRDLPHLNYRRFAPHPLLQDWVQCYWTVYLRQPPAGGFKERLYPDGGVSITLNLENPDRHWVSATQSLHLMRVSEPINSFGIRFHPAGAQWLLKIPINELVHKDQVRLRDFPLQNLNQLLDTLLSTSSLAWQVNAVDQWLLQQWRCLQPEINLAQRVVKRWPYVNSDFEGWCHQQGLNRRRVERAFQHYVGIAPGKYKALQQVRIARELIKQDPLRSLTDISQLSGYFDQAHLTRQFRKITDQTPGQYRHRQLEKTASK